jgi:hypothetical protein
MTAERSNYVHMATGFVVMAVGVLLLLVTNGVLPMRQVVQLWPAALVVIGAAVVLQALRGGEAARAIPIGGLVWLLVLGGLFSYTFDRRTPATVASPDAPVNVFSVMREQHPMVEGAFHGGQVTAVMGGANLDLRKAAIAPGETVVIDVFAVMGGGQIRVPEDWDVSIETTALMGAVKDRRGEGQKDSRTGRVAPDKDAGPAAWPRAPRLVLRGTVIMGGVDIRS